MNSSFLSMASRASRTFSATSANLLAGNHSIPDVVADCLWANRSAASAPVSALKLADFDRFLFHWVVHSARGGRRRLFIFFGKPFGVVFELGSAPRLDVWIDCL